jgi:Copper transport outer membrane protein, MctB
MFDYRYHALSLAAVLLALAVGVLLGVAIGDSDLVSSARNGIVSNLRSEVGDAHDHSDQLQQTLSSEEELGGDLYTIAVHGLLSSRKIGLVFLGEPSDQVNRLVREAVTQAGGELALVVAVHEPLDLAGLARDASSIPAGARYGALPSTHGLVRQFGLRMGVQLVSGGQLLTRVRSRLLSAFDGQLGKLDGLVVMRSEPDELAGEEAQVASEFEGGLVTGVTRKEVPAVGVELGSTEPSQVPWYKGQGISSVDDLDWLGGRAALTFALAGSHGAYGRKPSADSLLPRVVGGPAQP